MVMVDPLNYFYTTGITMEGNVLFNNVLNTFYLWLFDPSEMEKKKSLLSPFHGLFFSISSRFFF